jgi:hypothetical protein
VAVLGAVMLALNVRTIRLDGRRRQDRPAER